MENAKNCYMPSTDPQHLALMKDQVRAAVTTAIRTVVVINTTLTINGMVPLSMEVRQPMYREMKELGPPEELHGIKL